MSDKKYYVVWVGRKTGVFTDWSECKELIHGFAGAKYKSFPKEKLANRAFINGYEKYKGKNFFKKKKPVMTKEQVEKFGKPILESISVDAAWNTSNKRMEYKGVETETKKELFSMGPFENGTNNVGEFLALVHGLSFCKKNKVVRPIYSDSKTAISWVNKKKHKSKLKPTSNNKVLFNLLDRAILWLKNNEYENEVLKWHTRIWGEIPADFGRKR